MTTRPEPQCHLPEPRCHLPELALQRHCCPTFRSLIPECSPTLHVVLLATDSVVKYVYSVFPVGWIRIKMTSWNKTFTQVYSCRRTDAAGSFIVRSVLIWCTKIKVLGGGVEGGGGINERTWGKIKFVRRVFLVASSNCLYTLAFSRGSLCLNWKFYTWIVPPRFACFKFPHRPTGFIRRNYMPWAYGIRCMDCSETQVPEGSLQTLCRWNKATHLLVFK